MPKYLTVGPSVTVGAGAEAQTYRLIEGVYPAVADFPSSLPSGVERYVDSGDKAIAVADSAMRHQYVETVSHSIFDAVPGVEDTVDSQRVEIWNILLVALRTLDIARLSAKPGAVEAAGLRCRSLGAYAQQTTADAGFDTIKAAARDDLNVWALAVDTSANNTSWIPSLRAPGWFAYTRPDPLVIGGLPVPAATIPTGITAPTQAQLDSFDLRQALD